MRKALFALAVLSVLLGCAGSGGYAGSFCKGYFVSFVAEGSTGIEEAYADAKTSGIGIRNQSLEKTEFSGTPAFCPAGSNSDRPLIEYGSYCQYSGNGTDYRKEYRYFAFARKNGTGSYAFTVYERCDGRLKVHVDYSGSCKDEGEAMGMINETAGAIGIVVPGSARLVKNLG